MPSSDPPKPRYFRRMVWLAISIVVLFGGYSVGWFYVGDLLEREVKTALAEANAKGVSADCANPTARGYPFRIGLYCDAVSFSDNKGTSVAVGAFRSAAQVYNPFRIVGELDGPATVDVDKAAALKIDWQALRASVRLTTPESERLPLERVSVEGAGLAAGPASGQPMLNAKTFQGHMRPNGTDLDVAGTVGDLAADPALLKGRVVPPLSGELDATVANGMAMLKSRPKSLRGQSATIRALSISTDAATGVGVTGTIAADAAGLVDANLMVTVRNAKGLAEAAARAFPEEKDKIDKAMIGIGMLGESTSLSLKIVKGKAMLGFIPLGDVPPVE